MHEKIQSVVHSSICAKSTNTYKRGVYLCLIFEMSIWEFITNSKKIDLESNLIFFSSSNLIFTACVAGKNQVRNRQGIKFKNQFRETGIFKNQVQIDKGKISLFFLN